MGTAKTWPDLPLTRAEATGPQSCHSLYTPTPGFYFLGGNGIPQTAPALSSPQKKPLSQSPPDRSDSHGESVIAVGREKTRTGGTSRQ